MALFKKRPKTSQQKAQKAQLGIAARLIGCGYLVYIVIQLLQSAPEEGSMSQTLKIVIAAFFIAAAAAIMFFTVFEFIRNLKSGYYKADAYSDDINPAVAAESADGEPAHEEGAGALAEYAGESDSEDSADEYEDEDGEDDEDDEEDEEEDEDGEDEEDDEYDEEEDEDGEDDDEDEDDGDEYT